MKFQGWEKCSFSDYEACCEKFGYNAETSPHYIKFAMEQGVEPDFYAYTKKALLKVLSAQITAGWQTTIITPQTA